MVVRGGSHFCQSPKSGGGGGQEFFNQNMREGQHFPSLTTLHSCYIRMHSFSADPKRVVFS